ncbi:MAG: DUF3152 domain-containing protein [Micromonosporaceae bacterium]
MNGPDSWRPRRPGDAVDGARRGRPGERHPDDYPGYGEAATGHPGDHGAYPSDHGDGYHDDRRYPSDEQFDRGGRDRRYPGDYPEGDRRHQDHYQDEYPDDGQYQNDDRRYQDDDRRPGQSRLQRREVERRRQAQRRRRTAVLAILVLAGLLAGVDFARGGLLGPSPADVQASGDGRYINAPDPDNEPSPSASASASPSRSGKPSVPYSGSGKFVTASGDSEVLGDSGGVLRYRVRIEKDLDQDPAEFAEYVDTTLGDKRSWIRGGDVRLQRVSSGHDFTVYLATPTTTDRLCAPLLTSGFTSCRQGDNVVLNFARWVLGVEHWDGDLESYRRYVINHEVGHRLGHPHELCSGKGDPAPVMQQQTLKLAGCKGNAWPYVDGKLHRGPPGSYGGT